MGMAINVHTYILLIVVNSIMIYISVLEFRSKLICFCR